MADKIELTEPEEKVFQFLKKLYPRDFTIEELAERLNMERSTIHNHLLFLKRIKRIIFTRKVRKSKLYSYNPNWESEELETKERQDEINSEPE